MSKRLSISHCFQCEQQSKLSSRHQDEQYCSNPRLPMRISLQGQNASRQPRHWPRTRHGSTSFPSLPLSQIPRDRANSQPRELPPAPSPNLSSLDFCGALVLSGGRGLSSSFGSRTFWFFCGVAWRAWAFAWAASRAACSSRSASLARLSS